MKIVIHWWEDSSENWSCHRNERGLTAEQSLVGNVMRTDAGFFYLVRHMSQWIGPFTTLYEAKNKLLEAVDGEPLDIWA